MIRTAVVVGAGVIGASVALRLAGRGVAVDLVDGAGPATGTSSASFAWINVRRRSPTANDPAHDRAGRDPGRTDLAESYADLKVAATAEHIALRHELDDASWLNLGGCLDWSLPEGNGPEPDAQTLTRDEAQRVEPWLSLPPEAGSVRYFPFEGHVAVPRLVGLLVRRLAGLGGKLRTGADVVEFLRDGDSVRGVVLADGTRLAADAVVLCTGARTDQVCRLAGVNLPLAPTQGLLTVTGPSPVRLRTVLCGPKVHLRDDGDGRVMIGAYDLEPAEPVEWPAHPLPAAAAEAHARACAVLPALAGTPVEAVRMAPRAIPRDGYPVVGTPAGAPGIYVICTHGGVGMGPLLGRLAAREICGDGRDTRLLPFSPDRFTSITA